MIHIHRLRIVALSAVSLAVACNGTNFWVTQLQAEPLYRRAEKVVESPSCSALVPLEFARSFPVPARGVPKQFEVLLYPLSISAEKPEAGTPLFAARFARDTAATDACRRLPSAAARSLGAPVPAGLSMKAYYRAEARLFSSLDRTAALYFAGGTPIDKAPLADFADAFTTLAEPGLLIDYYRMNPDFWEWLRRETGRSIPACATNPSESSTAKR